MANIPNRTRDSDLNGLARTNTIDGSDRITSIVVVQTYTGSSSYTTYTKTFTYTGTNKNPSTESAWVAIFTP